MFIMYAMTNFGFDHKYNSLTGNAYD